MATNDLVFALTTDALDRRPLFSVKTSFLGGCVWSFATVADGHVMPVARVAEDLFATTPATADNRRYWFVFDGRYYSVAGDAEASRAPFAKGYSVKSIGAMASGSLFAIESLQRNGDVESDLRLVNIATGRSRPLRYRGWTESLARAWDGNLYFRLFEHWHCHVFEVKTDGRAADTAACQWENGHGIALGLDGGIWQPAPFGAAEYVGSRMLHGVSPFAKYTCVITNTAALEAHISTSDPAGNVWFAYASLLWMRNRTGTLFSTPLPGGGAANAMVRTNDGSLWIAGVTKSGMTALYRFISNAESRP